MSKNSIHLLLGPLLAIALGLAMLNYQVSFSASMTAGLTLLVAWWWATEAIPIPATSLIPFAGFPILGVLTYKEASAGLGSHIILLLMGGFIMAKGLERSGAHKRFAISILRFISSKASPKYGNKMLVLAFMLAASALSMWISNTATCLMLMPIVLACLRQMDDPSLTVPLIISVAYACSIGGIATLIGTPPNIIFAGIYEQAFGVEFGFMNWLVVGAPIVAVLLPTAWLWLTRNVQGSCAPQLPENTRWSRDEKWVVAVFVFIIFLWVFRSQPLGGLTALLNASEVGDSTIALLGATLMFVVRSEKGGGLLDWETAIDIPWGILLMFAAGITIATAFFASGLADIIGDAMSAVIVGMPIYLVMLMICASITFFTELNSNVATTTLILPILAATSISAGIAPELLMIPATISASCAFMLPVATAPNAIAYATGGVTVKDMLREGFRLNLIFAVMISAMCYLLLVAS
jgi:sodium-dependent dicarboxylate transporter 2/3/5